MMIEEEDNRLDRLFKKRLSDTDNSFAYNEEDWDKLEALMDQKEKRHRFLGWMRICTTIAAIALLFMGLWIFKIEKPLKEKKMIDNSQLKTSRLSDLKKSELDLRKVIKPLKLVEIANFSQNEINVHTAISPLNSQLDSSVVLTSNNVTVIDSPILSINQIATVLPESQENVLVAISPTPKIKKNAPVFTIGIIASSDINGVNSLKKSRVGSNYGMLLSMSLTKRLIFQTGINYAIKPYDIEYTYTSPYAYKVNPLSASANCEMLDIPINVDYTVLNHPKNKISIGTGLSSYIMLHEDYQYNYSPSAKANSTTYVIADSKSYLWSMLNVTATYQRKLSDNLGIIIQPYLKVPIKEVGYSNIKLHSAGISMGLQMNINRK